MSTVSGEGSVQFDPTPRRTRPGLCGRRLVLTCINQHRVPERERIISPLELWRCRECGTTRRTHTWFCAPLWLEAWEWVVWGARKLYEYTTQAS